MADEIELISDGDGLMVVGDAKVVDRFLVEAGIGTSTSREVAFTGLWVALGAGGALADAAGIFSANSGRWVKLTADSADKMKSFGLMKTETSGVVHAMVGQRGNIKSWLQIEQGASTLLSGPMMLPMIATVMSQQAMQRQMDEIQDYLVAMDEKIDDILRAQKDAVLADMIGVDLVVEEATTVRDAVGRVSEVTWSKVQSASMTIARTQAYAVRQLDAIAGRLEEKSDLGDIAKATRQAEPRVREWLAVIARCFQLQDGVSVLELDRVLDTTPADLDSHRIGLQRARQQRLDAISGATSKLLVRLTETVEVANKKVLLNPFDAPAAVRSSNEVATGVLALRTTLGIESSHESTEARRWAQAAGDVRARVVSAGTDAADRAADVFRPVDVDGDGIPDKRRITVAAEEAGTAMKDAAAGVSNAFGTLFQKRKRDRDDSEGSTTDEREGR